MRRSRWRGSKKRTDGRPRTQMRRTVAFVLTGATSFIAGCASIDASPAETLQITARQLGIDASSIVIQTPVRFAQTRPGERYAHLASGVYTQTRTGIELLEYDSKSKTFSKARTVNLHEIRSVRVLSAGLWSQDQQVQLTLADTILVLDCTNDPNADSGGTEKTKLVVDGLTQAGVAHERISSLHRPGAWVLPSEEEHWIARVPSIGR